jgi:hypothetical protein
MRITSRRILQPIGRGWEMSETTEAVGRLLQQRLEEIKQEAASLERALGGLGKNTLFQPSTPRSSKVTKSRRRRPRRPPGSKRAARGQRQQQLLTAIKQNPGARPAELARLIKVNPPQVHGLLRKARARKLIAKQGQGYKVKAN